MLFHILVKLFLTDAHLDSKIEKEGGFRVRKNFIEKSLFYIFHNRIYDFIQQNYI